MVTTNHGLAGGTLDATKHIEAAIPRLLNTAEIRDYRETILPAPPVTPAPVTPERLN